MFSLNKNDLIVDRRLFFQGSQESSILARKFKLQKMEKPKGRRLKNPGEVRLNET